MTKSVRRVIFGLLLLLIAVAGVEARHVASLAGIEPVSTNIKPAATVPAMRVIVRLADPPLALYEGDIEGYAATSIAATGQHRLDVESAASRAYLSYLQGKQAAFREQLRQSLPTAQVEYSYRILLNGLAVRLLGEHAGSPLQVLGRLPGVVGVYPEKEYRLSLDHSLPLIGAPEIWNALGGVGRAGEGLKIAIIDSGIYIGNPFFNAAGFSYPPGFPKGHTRYTTPKVIAARTYFRPDDPPALGEPVTPIDGIGHGTHVAGIAAGVANTQTPRGPLSGVAPRAWLMNYKVFYRPYSGRVIAFTPEILASMEDAVADGADVCNGSWGGAADFAPESDPMVLAAEAMVRAGVAVAFAAGNDGSLPASVNSPAIAPHAIAVGSTTTDREGDRPDMLSAFSSRGPGLGLSLKPDLAAPGEGIYSSFIGYFAFSSGTSMAAPHVSGAAALLRQLYPTWTPAQVKTALMTTANTIVHDPSGGSAPVGAMGQGAGRIDLRQAYDPGLLLSPPSHSFGEIQAGAVASVTATALNVSASGVYTVTVEGPSVATGLVLTPSVTTLSLAVGGQASFALRLRASSATAPGDYEGRVWLEGENRRLHIPWWVRVVPARPLADILLLDDDASSLGEGTDYLFYYTKVLADLELTYVVWDVGAKWREVIQEGGAPYGALPNAAYLKGFKAVLWFTGDSRLTYLDVGATEGDRCAVLDYLQNGGRLLVTGQDFSGYYLPHRFDSFNLATIGLGASLAGEDVYAPAGNASPFIGAEGVHTAPAFQGMRLDLGTTRHTTPTLAAGAGNLRTVDELLPIPQYDSKAIFRASPHEGAVGLAKSSDPTLESPLPAMPPGRAVYLSFGLEGINDDTGYTTRRDLLQRVLEWFADDLRVTISDGAAANPYDPATLIARASSNITTATFLCYRWDFGDGSAIVQTDVPPIAHVYGRAGTFHPRVEVMDSLGHTAVSLPGTVAVSAPPTPTPTRTLKRTHLPLLLKG